MSGILLAIYSVMLQVGVGGVVVKRIARIFTKEVLIGGTFGISHSVFHGDTADFSDDHPGISAITTHLS